MKFIGPDPDKGFTKIPNSLLSADITPGEFRTLCQICSLLREGESSCFPYAASGAAKALGVNRVPFAKSLERLKEKGLIIIDGDEWRLNLDAQGSASADTPVVVKKPKPEPVEEKQTHVAEEIAALPRRERTMSTVDRMALIAEAWNENKLEKWLPMRGSATARDRIAIDAHMQNVDHKRDDYQGFVARVVNGARIDSWWNSKDIKFSALFGGGMPEDKKFDKVKHFYNTGNTKKAKAAAFDYSFEAMVDWFKEKTDVFTSFERRDFPAGTERLEIDKAAFDESNNEPHIGRVYYMEGRKEPMTWTGQNYMPELAYLPAPN